MHIDHDHIAGGEHNHQHTHEHQHEHTPTSILITMITSTNTVRLTTISMHLWTNWLL